MLALALGATFGAALARTVPMECRSSGCWVRGDITTSAQHVRHNGGGGGGGGADAGQPASPPQLITAAKLGFGGSGRDVSRAAPASDTVHQFQR
eukprot:COSAG01_NODE_6503_length_3629_cov_17.985269_8_plen_94_part_00